MVLTAVGVAFLGLGILGAFLPVLPATPFILLAAWCFARARPDWHLRLRESRAFGPAVRDWEERGAVSVRAKTLATAMMVAAAAVLWFLSPLTVILKAAVTAVQGAVLAFLWSRPGN